MLQHQTVVGGTSNAKFRFYIHAVQPNCMRDDNKILQFFLAACLPAFKPLALSGKILYPAREKF